MLDPAEGFWTCVFDVHPTGPNDGVHCYSYFPNPYPDDPYYPGGGGTNAPPPVDDPRTEGDIVIIGTGTYAQDGGQPTTGWYDGSIDYADDSQPTTATSAPVDTIEDEGPTTVEPVEPEVVTEDEEITSFEYRRNRGGDEEMP